MNSTKVSLVFCLPVLGPLSVDAGRVKTHVDAVQNILQHQGQATRQMVYLDNAHESMDLLGACIWMRYLELCGDAVTCPPYALLGDYIFDFAATVHRRYGEQYRQQWPEQNSTLAKPDWLAQVRRTLGRDVLTLLNQIGSEAIVSDMQRELGEYGNDCDIWVYAREMHDQAVETDIQTCIDRLQAAGLLLQGDDQLWFQSPALEKEVLFQQGGELTPLGLFIVFCDMQLRKEDARTVFVFQACDLQAHVVQAMVSTTNQPLSMSVLQPVSIVENHESVPTSIDNEQAVSFRELCQSHGSDRVKLQFLSEYSGPVEIQVQQYPDSLLQLFELKEKLEEVTYMDVGKEREHGAASFTYMDVGKEREHGAASFTYMDVGKEREHDCMDAGKGNDAQSGTNCESDLAHGKVQWQHLLAQSRRQIAEAADRENPAILCQYLYRLANFIKTYYNALLSEPSPDLVNRDLLIETRSVLVQVLKLLGTRAGNRI